jgi:hypothetical protein
VNAKGYSEDKRKGAKGQRELPLTVGETMIEHREMDESLMERVRAACERVAAKAIHVQIDRHRISSYAASLPLERAERPEHDAGSHYLGHGEDTVAFFLTLDAINFGSGYFPHLRKRSGMSGYFTIASALKDHYEAHGPLSTQALTRLAVEDCATMFGQDLGSAPVRELMQLFATALNDLGRYLLDRFDGSFGRLVEAAGSSAGRLVQLLIEMPYFDDVALYEGLQVPFYKRAQLTAADLALAFGGRGAGHFDDLDRLTIFADNLVPHVLRVDGVLRYADDLAARIDREELIPPGCAEEIEIRACAVHAVELLSEALRRSGRDIPPIKLDYILWNRGQEPYYKARPRHRTRTVYY